jgi:hypothetical protein
MSRSQGTNAVACPAPSQAQPASTPDRHVDPAGAHEQARADQQRVAWQAHADEQA